MQTDILYIISYLENKIPTGLSFLIREFTGEFNSFDCRYIEYTPKMTYGVYYPSDSWEEIGFICEVLEQWIHQHVKDYIDDKDEIDLWDEYLKMSQHQQTKNIDFSDTGIFTYDEKQQILIALQSMNLNIMQNFQLNTEQLKLLNDGIKYLAEGVDRLNKMDWRTILIGQFFTIATAIATNPQQFTALYHMFINVIHIIYTLPQ